MIELAKMDPMALKEAMERALSRQRQRRLDDARRTERAREKLALICGREIMFVDDGRAM